jgi:ribosomal protein S18 acetylase RimI-like enzyme
LPDYRRKGVGSILLNTAQYYALHTRSKELILSTASDNIPAQKLYEEFGFVKDQDFYHYILGI